MDTITETMRNIEFLFKCNEPEERETHTSLSSKLVKKLMIEHNFENKDVFENRIKRVKHPSCDYTGKCNEWVYAELNNMLHSIEIGGNRLVLKDNRQNVYNYAIGTGKNFTTSVYDAPEGFIIVTRLS